MNLRANISLIDLFFFPVVFPLPFSVAVVHIVVAKQSEERGGRL